jgi:hypothetical protein
MQAITPATCGLAILVPFDLTILKLEFSGYVTAPLSNSDPTAAALTIFSPGANTSILGPQELKKLFPSGLADLTAPTVMTPGAELGVEPL